MWGTVDYRAVAEKVTSNVTAVVLERDVSMRDLASERTAAVSRGGAGIRA